MPLGSEFGLQCRKTVLMPSFLSSEKSERASVSQCVAPRGSGFNLVENTAFEIMQAKHAVL